MTAHNVEAYIGLGANLADPVKQLLSARQHIQALTGIIELAFSPLYRSTPVGPQDQPEYVNAVMRVHTVYSPLQLLAELQAIENAHDRVRNLRWGARTLDLDILLYGDQSIVLPELKIPHEEMVKRAFVLYPLADIAEPDLLIPGQGVLLDILANCPADGIWKITP